MAIRLSPDKYTKLLIRSDGPNNGQTFIDSSDSPHTLTTTSSVYHEWNPPSFPPHSGDHYGHGYGTVMQFHGDGDYIKAADHADWDFGTGDFTIDFWMYPTDATAGDTIINSITGGSGSNTGWVVYFGGGPVVGFYNILTGSALGYVASPTVTINSWSHVALVRKGDTHRIYLNGVGGSPVLYTGARDATTSNTGLYIGSDDPLGGYTDYTGFLDEIRISKGIARWTSNFVPPQKSNLRIDGGTQGEVAKEDSAFEVTGGGNAQFGSSIVTRSDPSEASTDSIFSVNAKDGTELVNVVGNGNIQYGQGGGSFSGFHSLGTADLTGLSENSWYTINEWNFNNYGIFFLRLTNYNLNASYGYANHWVGLVACRSGAGNSYGVATSTKTLFAYCHTANPPTMQVRFNLNAAGNYNLEIHMSFTGNNTVADGLSARVMKFGS